MDPSSFDGDLPSIPRVSRKSKPPKPSPSPPPRSSPSPPPRPSPSPPPRSKSLRSFTDSDSRPASSSATLDESTRNTDTGKDEDSTFTGKRRRVVADLESTESDGENSNAVANGRKRMVSEESDDDLKDIEDEGWSDVDVDDGNSMVVDGGEKIGGSRLTRRQRAMRGDLGSAAEISLLHSPWKKKKRKKSGKWKSEEDEEDNEETRAEKRRLRNMVNAKKNREKRAATVERVLRGTLAKKKKTDMETKTMSEIVQERLERNEPRKGCARYISRNGITTVSFIAGDPVPALIAHPSILKYPPRCTRDPKTGKRVFTKT